MNMKDVECFIKVYEQKSFSKAAELLYLTPQGVSKITKRLETEFGVAFFERSLSDGIHTTEYGSYFYSKACELVKLYNATYAGIESMKIQAKGILRLASAFGIFRFLTPEYINGFSKKFPEIKVDYMEYQDIYVKQNVLEGSYDLGIAPYLQEEKGLHIQHLFSQELYFITHKNSEFYNYKEVSLSEIVKEPLIIENKNFYIHRIIEDALKQYSLKYQFYFETSGFSMCYKLCSQKKGNTISMDFIFDDMKNPDLKIIPFKEHIMWNVGIMYKDDIPVSLLNSKFINYTKNWLIETKMI